MSDATLPESDLDESTLDFRPLQYLGSKWRILDQISHAVDEVRDPHRPTAVDLFSGTGVVARHLARSIPVIAADIQEYSRVVTSALLNPSSIDHLSILDNVDRQLHELSRSPVQAIVDWERRSATGEHWAEDLAWTLDHGSIETLFLDPANVPLPLERTRIELSGRTEWTLLRHYGGVYFSYEQAAVLDVISAIAHEANPEVRDTVLAAVLSTASEAVSSVGNHFAQPVRPRDRNGDLKYGQLQAVARARRIDIRKLFAGKLISLTRLKAPAHSGQALRAPFEDVLGNLPSDVGVVYADPPYTREHYSRFYHVLETIALGDSPGLSTMSLDGITVPSRGLYRTERHQSPFSIVSRAPSAFQNLFSSLAAQDIPLVLSYSPVPDNDKPRARVIGMDSLLEIAGASYDRVDVIVASGIKHSKFNSGSLNAPSVETAEVLIKCSASGARRFRN